MKTSYLLVAICLIFLLIGLTGCGPSESEAQATITQIVLNIIGTQTAQAPTPTLTPTLAPGQIRQSEIDGMEMVYIPPGEFNLGSTDEDLDATREDCLEFMDNCDRPIWEDELPQHKVQLDGFWIDRTEISVAMFSQFVNETGYETDAERFQYATIYNKGEWDPERDTNWMHPNFAGDKAAPGDPVVNVSWYDAWSYCDWAGRHLPTEAEWEVAARGTDLRTYPWGEEPPGDKQANLADSNLSFRAEWRNPEIDDGYQFAAPVDSYPAGASPYGILNMAGNVREWVYDWYSPDYSDLTGLENPVNVAEGDLRVVRGAGFATTRLGARTASRFGKHPYYASNDYSFRCVSSENSLPDPPQRDTPLPEIALVLSRTDVYKYDPSGLYSRIFSRTGTLKSFENLELNGQYNQCRYVRFSAPDIPEGWLYVSDNIILYKDCTEIEEVFLRPGTASWKSIFNGSGTLTAGNQGDRDAVIILERINPPPDPDEESEDFQYWMYIRAGEEATMKFIPDGSYQVYLATGMTWMPAERRFRDDPSYEQLENPLELTSTETTHSEWSLVIETSDGNTGSRPISESAFPE